MFRIQLVNSFSCVIECPLVILCYPLLSFPMQISRTSKQLAHRTMQDNASGRFIVIKWFMRRLGTFQMLKMNFSWLTGCAENHLLWQKKSVEERLCRIQFVYYVVFLFNAINLLKYALTWKDQPNAHKKEQSRRVQKINAIVNTA